MPSGNSRSIFMSFMLVSLPVFLGLLYINVEVVEKKAVDGCIPQPSAASDNTVIEMVIL